MKGRWEGNFFFSSRRRHTRLEFRRVLFRSLIVLMALEMSATTPPFGLLLFIMLGMVKGTTLFEVAMAAAPFLVCDMILIIILVIVPGLALFLPNLMGA